MARERRPDRTSNWADAIAVALEFVPQEVELVLPACAAAVFALLVSGWALSLLWENLTWI